MPSILRDHAHHCLLRAIEQSQTAYWASYACSPGGVFFDTAAVAWFQTAVSFPIFNGVLRLSVDDAALQTRVREVVAWFVDRDLQFAWYVGPDSRPSGIGEELVAHGLVYAEELVGMAIDLRGWHEPRGWPDGLEIVEVRTQEQLALWAQVLNVAYDIPADVGQENVAFQASLGFGDALPWVHYLGLLHGEPVATAHLLLAQGVAGINMVGVVPSARQRGIGRAITAAPLQAARAQGYEVGVLEATQVGLPVYEALGFQRFYSTDMYVWLGSAPRSWSLFQVMNHE